MIFCLGVSHKDVTQAEKWVDLVADMLRSERPYQPPLIVVATRSANRTGLREVQRKGQTAIRGLHVLEDEDEAGYPKSASHLFLRSLEYCEKAHPGEPIMWLEPDTLPMRPNWREEIAAEYAACGRPFLGQIERGHGPAHLCGCAVYPPNWRALAPMLGTVLTAPDIFWGPGLGQAFDTWASPETVPQTAEAKTFQQIWRPSLPITREWLRKNVRQEAALFHQCKDGSGFKAVREMHKL